MASFTIDESSSVARPENEMVMPQPRESSLNRILRQRGYASNKEPQSGATDWAKWVRSQWIAEDIGQMVWELSQRVDALMNVLFLTFTMLCERVVLTINAGVTSMQVFSVGPIPGWVVVPFLVLGWIILIDNQAAIQGGITTSVALTCPLYRVLIPPAAWLSMLLNPLVRIYNIMAYDVGQIIYQGLFSPVAKNVVFQTLNLIRATVDLLSLLTTQLMTSGSGDSHRDLPALKIWQNWFRALGNWFLAILELVIGMILYVFFLLFNQIPEIQWTLSLIDKLISLIQNVVRWIFMAAFYLINKLMDALNAIYNPIKQFIDHMVKITAMDFGSFEVPLPRLTICLPHSLGGSCLLKGWPHNPITLSLGRILNEFFNPFVRIQEILALYNIIFGAMNDFINGTSTPFDFSIPGLKDSINVILHQDWRPGEALFQFGHAFLEAQKLATEDDSGNVDINTAPMVSTHSRDFDGQYSQLVCTSDICVRVEGSTDEFYRLQEEIAKNWEILNSTIFSWSQQITTLTEVDKLLEEYFPLDVSPRSLAAVSYMPEGYPYLNNPGLDTTRKYSMVDWTRPLVGHGLRKWCRNLLLDTGEWIRWAFRQILYCPYNPTTGLGDWSHSCMFRGYIYPWWHLDSQLQRIHNKMCPYIVWPTQSCSHERMEDPLDVLAFINLRYMILYQSLNNSWLDNNYPVFHDYLHRKDTYMDNEEANWFCATYIVSWAYPMAFIIGTMMVQLCIMFVYLAYLLLRAMVILLRWRKPTDVSHEKIRNQTNEHSEIVQALAEERMATLSPQQ